MRYTAILVGALAVGVCASASVVLGDDTSAMVDGSVGFLPCTPVGVDGPTPWGVSPGFPEMPAPIGVPSLTVVITDIRPGRARLYLDGRFIGRADEFDGRPDALFLEPGTYTLEARLGGYRSDRFELTADIGCRYDIRHWLERERGEPVERLEDGPPSPFPLERVFGPAHDDSVVGGPSVTEPRPPDAAGPPGPRARSIPRSAVERATLILRVTPPQATVTLDGELLATGEELMRVQAGLAVEAGRRVLEVSANGYRPVRLALDLVEGGVAEHVIELEPDGTEGQISGG